MDELKLREKQLLEMNAKIDRQNEQLLKQLNGVSQSKIDREIDQLADADVDFKDLDDEESQADLRFDYSQVDPYDRHSLKKSQRPLGAVADSDMVDSLHLNDGVRPKRTMEDEGTRFLKKADEIRKKELIEQVATMEQKDNQISELTSSLHMKQQEAEELKRHLASAIKDLETRDGQVKKLEDKALRLSEECQKLTGELKAAGEKHEQLKGANMEARRQLGGLEKQKQGVEREQSSMAKTSKKFETELGKKDQR